MKSLDKERRKLEKAGFTGQTLERAMELLERTNASILAETLVKMVTRQEKTPSMALHEAEIKMRELETKLGLSPRNRPKKEQNEVTGSRHMCLLPLLFCASQSCQPAFQSKDRGAIANSYFMPSSSGSLS